MSHCTFHPKLVSNYVPNERNTSSKHQSEETMDEFGQDSYRNSRAPAITIEKLIVKDGETIHMKKM
jgi:hypothetical protein